jgi:hypothetical protein
MRFESCLFAMLVVTCAAAAGVACGGNDDEPSAAAEMAGGGNDDEPVASVEQEQRDEALRATYPLVEFGYTTGHDYFHCVAQPFGALPARWSAALDRSIPYYQTTWNQRGEPLFATTAQLLGPKFFSTTDRVGRRVPIRNLQATFTMCPGSPGMGLPVLLQMGTYVDKDGTGLPIAALTDEWLVYAFHEFLHKFIDDKARSLRYDGAPVPGQPTPALAYWSTMLDASAASMPTVIKSVVLQHLHLLAIMKSVFLKLGRNDLVTRTRTYDSSADTTGSMGLAWTIVDQADATDILVDEIKTRSR